MTVSVALSGRATVTESRNVIIACTALEHERGPAVLDLSAATRFGPFGVGMLATAIALRRHSGHATELILPADDAGREFLEEVGLPRFVRGEEPRAGTLELRQLHALDPVYTEAVTQMLVRNVAGIDEAAAYTVTLCLNELLQNVLGADPS
ncbi:MAG: hypothetical protein JW751_04805 [Polyangiaceae bacterium]|nr:hypothetical protein [Polyangiaceae bacterium]